MSRYALEVAYDGTAFHGSQIQGDTPTVQLSLNTAISTLLRRPIETYGSSRTDEGVHALGNFYHFDADETLNAHSAYQLNAILPHTLGILAIYRTAPDFNARFDAASRRYRYRIYRRKNPFLHLRALHFPYKLDRTILDETAAVLKEYTDFESFSKRNAQTKTYKCTILQSYWEEQGEELHYVVEANRFLRGMVRGLVGTQLRAGRGKYDVDEFRSIIESGDCRRADFSPKGWGLYLEKVVYPAGMLEAV
jgi:tRNA pseudouridine38-40 synthase